MEGAEKLINSIAGSTREEASKTIIKLFKMANPNKYNGITMEDLTYEVMGINMLTIDIDCKTLSQMCYRAIKRYAVSKSNKEKCSFDINYILSFFIESFNYVHSDCVALPECAIEVSSMYDSIRNIKWQKWECNGIVYETASTAYVGDMGGIYSLKDRERQFTNLNELDLNNKKD